MGDSDEIGLPASVIAAWRGDVGPTRGPRRGLSIERLVEAAIIVATRDGLAALSMGRVATQLGAAPMSLYRYVATKDELLTLMGDSAYGPPPPAASASEGWRAGLARWAWAEHDVLRRHPWLLRIPIVGPPVTPNLVGWFESGLKSLDGSGLRGSEKPSAILLISSFVRAEASLMASVSAAIAAASADAEQASLEWADQMRELTDPEHYPALTRTLAEGVFDRADDPDDEFVFGLERILDGIDVLIQSRTAVVRD